MQQHSLTLPITLPRVGLLSDKQLKQMGDKTQKNIQSFSNYIPPKTTNAAPKINAPFRAFPSSSSNS